MLNNLELMDLEKKYFYYISDIIESHLGEILNQIGSYKDFTSSSIPSSKSNIYENKIENIVESIVTRQLGWPVCVTPISADSCYECGDAIIHIDAKTRCEKVWSEDQGTYIWNGDYTQNKIVAEKNETTYDSAQTLMYRSKSWNANLSHYIDHRLYGEVPNLTYFFIIDYTLSNDISQISLVCIPHGQFSSVFGNSILGAGKSNHETLPIRKNIRFLVNKILLHDDHNWRYRVCYRRK